MKTLGDPGPALSPQLRLSPVRTLASPPENTFGDPWTDLIFVCSGDEWGVQLSVTLTTGLPFTKWFGDPETAGVGPGVGCPNDLSPTCTDAGIFFSLG